MLLPKSSPSAYVVALLELLGHVPGSSTIAFDRPNGERVAELLVSHGEVCLMGVPGGRPLGQRLRDRDPAAAVAIAEAVTVARTRRRPLGEVICELGKVNCDLVREALVEQMADGFAAIGRAAPEGLVEVILSGSSGRLSSTLTGFSPVELYWRAIPLVVPPVTVDAASRCYRELHELAGAAALLARTGDAGGAPELRDGPTAILPLEATGFDLPSFASIRQLACAVEQIAAPPALLAAQLAPQLLFMGAAEAELVCVVTPERIALFADLDRSARARVLGRARQILAEDE